MLDLDVDPGVDPDDAAALALDVAVIRASSERGGEDDLPSPAPPAPPGPGLSQAEIARCLTPALGREQHES